jgi:hypothetical protein
MIRSMVSFGLQLRLWLGLELRHLTLGLELRIQ